MQVELTLEQLEYISNAVQHWQYDSGEDDINLLQTIGEAVEQAQELQALDLNDCGDSCKL